MAAKDFEVDPDFSTVGGVPLMKLARNPHLNVDTVHSDVEQASNTIVRNTVTVPEIANGQSVFVDVEMALVSDLQYSFNVSGYASYTLVQTSVNRQAATICRVVVDNESGLLIPSLPITITATSL